MSIAVWQDSLRIPVDSLPVIVNVVQGWDWTDVVSLALTAALVLFAFVEIRGAKAAERDRQRAADARLSADAYRLRTQLINWLGRLPVPHSQNPEVKWGWSNEVNSFLHGAERQMTNSVELAANASDEVGRAMKDAYVKYFRVRAALDDVTTTWQRYKSIDVTRTQEAMKECAAMLVGVIDPELLSQKDPS